MLIVNMASNFMFVCNLENYKCDSPNSSPIHVFTHILISSNIDSQYSNS
jgi:hypothetical protein